MTKEILEADDYEVSQWLEKTHWPTRETDIDEMVMIYHQWQQTTVRSTQTGELDEELLVQMTLKRMRHIHPNQRDACVITALLILQTAFVARNEGVYSPGLTKRLH